MNIVKETLDYIKQLVTFWVMIQPWELGIRVRLGKHSKLLKPGMHWKLPIIDRMYSQTIRLRVVAMPLQTITSRDGVPISIMAAVGFQIEDILKVFESLHAPETTIANIVQSHIADFVCSKMKEKCLPSDIERYVENKIQSMDYGLEFKYVKIISYASVRTFRLMNDNHYAHYEETMKIDDKR